MTVPSRDPNLKIKLIISQLALVVLAPVWILKVNHYFFFPMMSVFGSPTLIPTLGQAEIYLNGGVSLLRTVGNLALFGVFFLQHIVMASMKFKIWSGRRWGNFHVYERIIYNLISSILLILVLQFQSPQNYILFTLSLYVCLPLFLFGLTFFILANLQMSHSLLLPYSFSKLFGQKQIQIPQSDLQKTQQSGIQIKGLYSLVRHPMQSGSLFLLTFGSTIFTLEKVILMVSMLGFILVGVLMEEKRLLKKYTQYKAYKETVKARFIPYLI